MFVNFENRKDLEESINLANKITPKLIDKLKNSKINYECSNADSQIIGHLMESFKGEIKVKTYWYWRAKVLGYFSPSEPDAIYLNRKAFPRSAQSLVASYFHEKIHYLDHISDDYYFHHGDNTFRTWKLKTAPYAIDAMAEELALEELNLNHTNRDPSENNQIVTRRRRRWYFLWLA